MLIPIPIPIPTRLRLLLIGLLLCPAMGIAKMDPGGDSLTYGTIVIRHYPKHLVQLAREHQGGKILPGTSRWKRHDLLWGYGAHHGDSVTYARMQPGNYSVWGLDSAYRLVSLSFPLGKGERRFLDARTGSGYVGKKAVARIVDKATRTPVPGALVFYKCPAPGAPDIFKPILHQGVVTSDSLGRFETPPCLNKKDTLHVQLIVGGNSMRKTLVKMAAAMDEDSLWRVGDIPLGEKETPRYEGDRKAILIYSNLTYSLGLPLSDEVRLHAFSHALHGKFFGVDYGVEVPNGSVFVNLKGWFPTGPVLRGNWTLPLGILGAGLGLYRNRDEEIGYQVQAGYNLLLAHVNLKARKEFDGPYTTTLGLGISVPLYFAGKR